MFSILYCHNAHITADEEDIPWFKSLKSFDTYDQAHKFALRKYPAKSYSIGIINNSTGEVKYQIHYT